MERKSDLHRRRRLIFPLSRRLSRPPPLHHLSRPPPLRRLTLSPTLRHPTRCPTLRHPTRWITEAIGAGIATPSPLMWIFLYLPVVIRPKTAHYNMLA